jgi:hypothetical protein
MDDFVPHIYGRTELHEGAFDDLDRPLDAGTEAARLGQNDLHGHLLHQPAPLMAVEVIITSYGHAALR